MKYLFIFSMYFGLVYANQCVEVYDSAVWSYSVADSVALGCPICLNETTMPPFCVCNSGSFISENKSHCIQCGEGFFCRGVLYSPQACPRNSDTAVGALEASDCKCKDGYEASAASGCQVCDDTKICVNGSVYDCGSNSRVQGKKCTCVEGYFHNSTSGICVACLSGSYCPGGGQQHECPAHSISDKGAVSVQACHCLPPYSLASNGLVLCVDASRLDMSMSVTGTEISKLVPGSVIIINPSHCNSQLCPGYIGLEAKNATHVTLHLFNIIVRPAYLELLYSFLYGARILEAEYVGVRDIWSPSGSGVSVLKCSTYVRTEARLGQDPRLVHEDALNKHWSDIVMDSPDILENGVFEYTALVSLSLPTLLSETQAVHAIRSCNVKGEAYNTSMPTIKRSEFGTGSILLLKHTECPDIGVLECLTRDDNLGRLSGDSVVVCESEIQIFVRSMPEMHLNFSCDSGYTTRDWNHTSSTSEIISFAENENVHVVGRIELEIPHAPVATAPIKGEITAFWAQNTSAWRNSPVMRSGDSLLARVFHVLGFGHLENVGIVPSAISIRRIPRTSMVEMVVESVLMRMHECVALLHVLQATAGVSVRSIGSEWRKDGPFVDTKTEVPAHNMQDAANLSLQSVFVSGNETWRPLGELVNMSTRISGSITLSGILERVLGALSESIFQKEQKLLTIYYDESKYTTDISCNNSNATSIRHDFWTAVVTNQPIPLTSSIMHVAMRAIFNPTAALDTGIYPHTAYPEPIDYALVFRTENRGCSREELRNPDISDEDLINTMTRIIGGPLVSLETHCVVTCQEEGLPLHEVVDRGAYESPVYANLKVGTDIVFSDDGAPFISWLRDFTDVVSLEISTTQSINISTQNSSLIAEVGTGIFLATSGAIPASPRAMLGLANGLSYSERGDAGCAGTMCFSSVGLSKNGASCLKVSTHNEAMHTGNLLREIRNIMSTAAPISIKTEIIQAVIALDIQEREQISGKIISILEELGGKMEIGDPGPWNLLHVAVVYHDLLFTPTLSAIQAVVWGEIRRNKTIIAQNATSVTHLFSEVVVKENGMPLSLSDIQFMRPMIQELFRDLLDVPSVLVTDVSSLGSTKFQINTMIVTNHGEDCIGVATRFNDILSGNGLASLQVLASVKSSSCHHTVKIYTVQQDGVIPQKIRDRAIFNDASSINIDITPVPLALPWISVAKITAPDLDVFDRMIFAALGDSVAGNAQRPSVLNHLIDLCGIPETSIHEVTAQLAFDFG